MLYHSESLPGGIDGGLSLLQTNLKPSEINEIQERKHRPAGPLQIMVVNRSVDRSLALFAHSANDSDNTGESVNLVVSEIVGALKKKRTVQTMGGEGGI